MFSIQPTIIISNPFKQLLLIHVLSSQLQLTVLNNRLRASSLFLFVNGHYSRNR